MKGGLKYPISFIFASQNVGIQTSEAIQVQLLTLNSNVLFRKMELKINLNAKVNNAENSLYVQSKVSLFLMLNSLFKQ